MLQLNSTSGRAIFASTENLLPAILILLGLGLSAAAALLWQYNLEDHAEVEFQRVTLQVSNEIEARFHQAIYGLNVLKSLYATNPKLSVLSFARFWLCCRRTGRCCARCQSAALLGLLYAPVVITELLEGVNTVAIVPSTAQHSTASNNILKYEKFTSPSFKSYRRRTNEK